MTAYRWIVCYVGLFIFFISVHFVIFFNAFCGFARINLKQHDRICYKFIYSSLRHADSFWYISLHICLNKYINSKLSGFVSKWMYTPFFHFQKSRLARIRMAKNASGKAFLNSKKRAEEHLLLMERGEEMNDVMKDQDIFELQHHHLLNCLEKTTVRWWMLLSYGKDVIYRYGYSLTLIFRFSAIFVFVVHVRFNELE